MSEISAAKNILYRQVQRESYSMELSQLMAEKSVPRDSTMYKLLPFIDEAGVIRVGGRIEAASWLPYSARHPIILPSDHRFTELVIKRFHAEMKHQHSEATICRIRKDYWIPKLRQLLRKVIRGCRLCSLSRITPKPPVMGNLPEDRVTPYVRPFTYTGVDYFGPVTVTIGRRHEKRWVALFTCLTVRAIHLEIAFDLSTDACILALRNFINRRGVPLRIRSDNGKNFVGANEEAKRFDEVFDCTRLNDEASTRGIEWLFNCPSNPSEGGVWERMVQSVKKVLRTTLKESAPREHTLQSFLIEAENIVNSRPLTHIPIDPDQEEPLTPNHFLLGSANHEQISTIDESQIKTYVARKQWRIACELRRHFWKRWTLEYLPTLTRRTKWCERTEPLKVGDLVFICDPALPRYRWSRGRIEEVYGGKDGQIRRVNVRTNSGVLSRPASRLAKLDVESESGSGDVKN